MASHIVGGELSYQYLNNNNYKFTLKLYRDCNSQTQYSQTENLTIYTGANVLFTTATMNYPGAVTVPNNTGSLCLSAPPNVCVEQAVYTCTVNLPPQVGGYIAVFQRCCRNATIANITNPGSLGATYTAFIPDPAIATNNNSPTFNNFPPTIVCVNHTITFDHSATDVDGDSLVYSFCPALQGAGQGNPQPNPATPPPYTSVPYSGGFTYLNPLTGAPGLSINPQTGVLTGYPTAIGQFVVAVCVSEYRNGVLIGVHQRDFQFNVNSCVQNIVASIGQAGSSPTFNVCINSPLTFTNYSTGANTYAWNFGIIPGTNNTAYQPTYTYTAAGTYNVTLIVNGGTQCADTAHATVIVHPIPTGTTSNSGPVCAGQNVTLNVSSAAGTTFSWTGPGGFTSTASNPTIFNIQTSGTYTVAMTNSGCTGTTTTSVVVYPLPTAIASANTPLCAGQNLHLAGGSTILPSSGYLWSGPNGFSSTLQSPIINAVTAVNAGTYFLTSYSNGCPGISASVTVVVNPIPAQPTSSSNSPICAGQTLQLNSSTVVPGATFSWTGPNNYASGQQNPTRPNATTAMSGTYNAYTILNGCNSLPTVVNVVVNPIPVPVPSSNSPVCSGNALNLFSTLQTNSTYSWTGPGGFTSSQQNPVINNATTAMSGTYNLAVSALGCTSAMVGTIVVVNQTPATPVISATNPACLGQAVTFSVASVANATYSWTGPNGITASTQSFTINSIQNNQSGIYSCIVTVNGCSSVAGTLNLTVQPTPVATATATSPVCAGNPFQLHVTSAIGNQFNWTGPNGFSSTLQTYNDPSGSQPDSGLYTVTASLNGCTSLPSSVNVLIQQIPVGTVSSNSPVCAGQTLHLTGSSNALGSAYSWSGPNGFSMTQQNPNITNTTAANAGTYTLTVSANGCPGLPVTTNVVINPIPTAPVVSSNSPVCAGQSIMLNATSGQAGVTYSWTGPAGYTSNQQNPVRNNSNAMMAGNYSAYTNLNGCQSNASTIAVVVNPIPVATASSNSAICAGTTLNLFSTAQINGTYSWTGPNGFISNQQNPSITNAPASAAGTYSLSVTANGCVSANTSNTVVVVNPIPSTPVITATNPACANHALTMSVVPVVNATYSWTGPNGWTGNTSSVTIPNIQSNQSGTYSCLITVNGCGSASGTININVQPTPVVTATTNAPTCVGNPFQINATSAIGNQFSWTGPGGFTSTQQNVSFPSAAIAQSGLYIVTSTLNGCISNPSSVSVVINNIPTAPVVSNNSPVCSGQTLNFTCGAVVGATSYLWSGPNSFSAAILNPSISNVQAVATGTYTISANVPGCGTFNYTTNAIVNQTPSSPTLSSNTPLCEGQTLNLLAATVAGGNFNWTGPLGYTSNQQNPSVANIQVSQAGSYNATVTVAGCISQIGITSVVVNTVPSSTFTVSSPVCSGQDATVLYTGNGLATANYNWNFNNANIVSGSSSGPYAINWPSGGNYPVTLTVTQNGCTSTQSSTLVQVLPTPSSTFTVSPNLCLSDSTIVTYTGSGTAAGTYNWSFGSANVLNGSGSGPFTVGYNSGGTYNISLQLSENGCTSTTTTQTINVIPNATSTFILSDHDICPNETITFTYTGSGSAAGNYNWSFGGGVVTSGTNAGPLNVQYANPSTYYINLDVTENGCSSTLTTDSITVHPMPLISFSANPVIGCDPLDVSFTNQSNGAATYLWNFGDGNTSTIPNPLNTYTAGYYGVQLIGTTAFGCVDSLFIDSLIQVVVPPSASFSVSPDFNTYVELSNALFQFTNNSSNASNYVWNFGDGVLDNTNNPSHIFTQPGNYSVTLVAMNNIGCTDTAMQGQLLVIPDAHYFIPNTFTPNGDGINDNFLVYGESLNQMTMTIFDRWGQKVYEGDGLQNGWDGTTHGKPCNGGVYVYLINITTLIGKQYQLHGDITLLK